MLPAGPGGRSSVSTRTIPSAPGGGSAAMVPSVE